MDAINFVFFSCPPNIVCYFLQEVLHNFIVYLLLFLKFSMNVVKAQIGRVDFREAKISCKQRLLPSDDS